MVHIPRIGQEVLVDFMNGDINDPIVLGSLYNADMMPPYDLPGDKTQSGIKSRSTLSGNPDTFNEICFEDKKGEELLYIRAEKDLTRAVENDEVIWVGNDRWADVDNNETINIDKGDRKVTLNQGNDTHEIKQGNRDVLVDMGNDSLTIKMGNQTTKLNLGQSSTEAMQSIELKVGQSSLKVDQMGVTIKGMMISIEGQLQTQVKGVMTQINGSAMLQVGGGITMIG
jgi:type VI secretion system secreted protein VgrG